MFTTSADVFQQMPKPDASAPYSLRRAIKYVNIHLLNKI